MNIMKTQIALLNVKHTQKNNNLISFCFDEFQLGENQELKWGSYKQQPTHVQLMVRTSL